MKKVRIGFVGCGRHLMRSLLPNIVGNENTVIVAACDTNKERVLEFNRRFPGIKTFSSFDKMLENNDFLKLDAVVISMDPIGHLNMSKLAIENNLHVFVEKPTGFSSQELQKLAFEAQERELITCVGSKWRYTKATRLCKEYIENKKNSKLCCLTFDATFPSILDNNLWGLDNVRVSLYDMFIHAFDYISFWLGDIKEITPLLYEKKDGSIVLSLQILSLSGCIANVCLSSGSAAYQHNFICHLTDGTQIKIFNLNNIEITENGSWIGTTGTFRDHPSYNWDQGRMYRGYSRAGYAEEWECFINGILEKKDTYTNLFEAAKTLALIEKCILRLNESKQYDF